MGTLENKQKIGQYDTFPPTEKHLISYIYRNYGPGTYTVLINRGVLRSAWRGSIQHFKDRKGRLKRIEYKALKKNSLEYHCGIEELTSPEDREWRKVRRPRKHIPDPLKDDRDSNPIH
ncbi:MAG: hypothetical protein V5A72_02680 [Candidatus Nanohaloarchaea archaeon]